MPFFFETQKFFLLIDERGNKNENGKASVCEKEEEKVNIFGNNLCNFRPEVSFLLFFSFYLCKEYEWAKTIAMVS